MNPYPYVLNNPLKYVDPLELRYEVGTAVQESIFATTIGKKYGFRSNQFQ